VLLPTKTLSPGRSLVGIGASVLMLLTEPKPVSRVWDEYKKALTRVPNSPTVTFGWFVLALDLLFAFGVIEFDHNRLVKTSDVTPAQTGEQR
jgi:hypothetical protein